MSENNSKKLIINGLLYVGGLLSLNFLLKVSNNSILSIIAFAISVANLVLMYRFATRYRDEFNEGAISFGKSFRFLFQLYFYGNIITSIIVLIYAAVINPNFSEILTSQALTMYEKLNIPVADSTYNLVQTMYQPAPMAFINILSGAFGAAFWALILSLFVKKDKSIFDQQQ